MNELTHRIYKLCLEGTPFYIGYTEQPLETRLSGHIQAARNPTKQAELYRVLRGKPSKKDVWILAAVEDNLNLTIEVVEEKYQWELLDENYWIEWYREQGHPITNVMVGGCWQKYVKMPDGSLVEVDKSISDVEHRQDIQEWKSTQKLVNGHLPPTKKTRAPAKHKTPPPTYTTTIPYDIAMSWAKKFWNNSTLQKGCETFDEYWIEFQKDYERNGCEIKEQ